MPWNSLFHPIGALPRAPVRSRRKALVRFDHIVFELPNGRTERVAKPVSMEVDIVEDEVTTLEMEIKKGRESPHLNKDGMPYGSYDK